MNNQQPFDREECLRIYLALLHSPEGKCLEAISSLAVSLAQNFYAEMSKHPTAVHFPAHHPTYTVGRFYSSDVGLYIESSDGSQALHSEFAHSSHATDWAIALNKALEVTR